MLKKAIFGGLFFLAGQFAQGQVTFVIESLPGATHSSDTIFICGSFNNWNVNDPSYIVNKQLNGQLMVALPAGSGKIEYKFTRGNWNKVETGADNQLIKNREFTYGNGNTVYVQIENWLDQGGARALNYLIFYFFACAFQGVALCFMISRISRRSGQKFKTFLTITIFLIALLLLMVLHEISNQIWQSYFVFVFHIVAFCWAPLTLYFLNSFSDKKIFRDLRAYFIPAGVASLIVIVRILNINFFDFLSIVIKPPLTLGNALFILISVGFNAFLFFRAFQRYSFLKLRSQPAQDENASFLFYFFWTSCTALFLVPVNALLILNGFTHPFFENFNSTALVLSALIFIEAYFIWRYPQIIKEERVIVLHSEEDKDWFKTLDTFMLEEKPYRHPELSISELAEMLGTRAHVLSRVIHDHYHKNFRDFVNTYRVEEFIALANLQQYKHYTFLALAQEVGFNSKSTFNVAFKKLTNQNPRDYFKTHA